jgi:multicomponent Na+:H+ antiporter subunit E
MRKNWFRVVLFGVLLILWLLLTRPVDLQETAAALIVALILTGIPLPGSEVFGEISLLPKKVVLGFAYLLYFLAAVVKSNIDVAFRVLSPRLPINPGIVRVRTGLKSSLARMILANSITLTPGTITVDIRGEDLFIHWINIQSADIEESTKKIVSDFERRLEVIFG